MKRFHFQLQTAMDWRRRRMETEQARLDELLTRQARLNESLLEAGRSWEESRTRLLASTSIDAGELAALETYRHAVDHQKRRLAAELVRTEEAIGKQRQAVLAATRDFRLLEKLRDRRLSEWNRQAAIELENEAGELYLAKRARQSKPV